jgi:hypothetical protein
MSSAGDFFTSDTDHPRQSGTARHDSIAMVHHTGMAAVSHGESAGESHHVHGSCRGDPAAHRRPNASLEIEQRILREEVSVDPSRDHQHLTTIRASCPTLPGTTQRLCRKTDSVSDSRKVLHKFAVSIVGVVLMTELNRSDIAMRFAWRALHVQCVPAAAIPPESARSCGMLAEDTSASREAFVPNHACRNGEG